MAHGTDEYGLKRSSGVDYSQVQDRQVDDQRFERQRRIRAAPSPVLAEKQPVAGGTNAGIVQSATMDAFMRMVTGKEERTIADRIRDPNRPTWEQYKKENADKLDLNGNEEKAMKEYRKQLDAAREKRLAGGSAYKRRKKKHKKRAHSSSSSSDDDDTLEDERRRSKHKSRKKRKSHKRRNKSLGVLDASHSDTKEDCHSGRHERSKENRKLARKKEKRDASPSPVRLSSFLQRSSDESV